LQNDSNALKVEAVILFFGAEFEPFQEKNSLKKKLSQIPCFKMARIGYNRKRML